MPPTTNIDKITFDELDWRCINTIRTLAIDMVQRANSGHPGAPMGLAPLAHVLFTRFLRCNPSNAQWMGRDRFVLSNGHACALQYALLHLLGYDVSLEDLKQFRQTDSRLPGHPESHLTPGVEVSTGPLGQGVANAVGLAIAEAHMSATLNEGTENCLIDNYTYVFLGDGCQMEGIASEAASLAGHLRLGKLIMFYDDNHISIDGGTDLTFTEDVLKRFEAYGFHCQRIADGDHDLNGIAQAIMAAQQETDRPSLISIRTTIGFGSRLQGTEKVHGAPLGVEEVKAVKRAFGFNPDEEFAIPDDVRDFYRQVEERGKRMAQQWEVKFASYSKKYPERAEELLRRLAKRLPDNIEELLPRYEPGSAEMATRKVSENVLNAIAPHLPELIGGSADLTHSNLTKWKGSMDFQPPSTGLGNYGGRYIRYGVREHAMFGISNGICAYGGLIPFASTFLNFITYGWGSVRLSALSHQRVLYIMTHDSIGLGEDGPTHQPIETLAALRALPNMVVIRPADGNEVSGAYLVALKAMGHPTVICLSRQNLPQLHGTSIEKVFKGAYVLADVKETKAHVILVGTGSEMSLAIAAAEILGRDGIKVRLVSMPSWELFDQQPLEYRQTVFPPNIPIISVEALSTLGWSKYAHVSIGMTTFGSSGPYKEIYRKFGFTPENIATTAKKALEYYQIHPIPDLLSRPIG